MGRVRAQMYELDPQSDWRNDRVWENQALSADDNAPGRFTYDFTTNLAAYTTPVLFIAGSQSEILGESLQRQQIGRYPSASLEIVAGAAQDVVWAKAAEVVARVRRYFGS